MIEQLDTWLQINAMLVYYIAVFAGIIFRLYGEWKAIPIETRPKFDLAYLWNGLAGLIFSGGLTTIQYVGGDTGTWQATAITGYYIGLGSTHMSRVAQRAIVYYNEKRRENNDGT